MRNNVFVLHILKDAKQTSGTILGIFKHTLLESSSSRMVYYFSYFLT